MNSGCDSYLPPRENFPASAPHSGSSGKSAAREEGNSLRSTPELPFWGVFRALRSRSRRSPGIPAFPKALAAAPPEIWGASNCHPSTSPNPPPPSQQNSLSPEGVSKPQIPPRCPNSSRAPSALPGPPQASLGRRCRHVGSEAHPGPPTPASPRRQDTPPRGGDTTGRGVAMQIGARGAA